MGVHVEARAQRGLSSSVASPSLCETRPHWLDWLDSEVQGSAYSPHTHQVGYRCVFSPFTSLSFKKDFHFLNYVLCGGGVGGEAST